MRTKRKPLKDSSVFFATFSPWIRGIRLPTNGSVEPMIAFFRSRVKEFVLLDQPIPTSDFLLPRYEIYGQEKTSRIDQSPWFMRIFLPFLTLTNTPKTQVSFKIRDFFSVIIWPYIHKTKYDLFIGMESINALAGVVLRTLGKVDVVVYYVSDYSPHRYTNALFNDIYLWLDRQAATLADYIWDVSLAMQPARLQAGLDRSKSAPEIHVPNGLYPSQIKASPPERVRSYALVYLGTLGEENGPDVAIEALPTIIRKFSDSTLHIIGGNESDIARLRVLADKLRVTDRVVFHGFVLQSIDATQILNKCALAVAPYRSFPGSPRYYADAGKIRIYCGAGLPVVTTEVPPLGQLAYRAGAAAIARDTPRDFARVICEIFSDRKRYLLMRKSAIQFAKDSTWDRTFSSALTSMDMG